MRVPLRIAIDTARPERSANDGSKKPGERDGGLRQTVREADDVGWGHGVDEDHDGGVGEGTAAVSHGTKCQLGHCPIAGQRDRAAHVTMVNTGEVSSFLIPLSASEVTYKS